MVLKISSHEEYDELLASETSIVIFTANWCKYYNVKFIRKLTRELTKKRNSKVGFHWNMSEKIESGNSKLQLCTELFILII